MPRSIPPIPAGAAPDPADPVTRRGFVGQALAAAATLAFGAPARAQGFPTRPLRILVGNSAGSAADTVARAVGLRLAAAWGQSVLVENRLGAGGLLAAEAVAHAPADGYTLLLGQEGALAIAPALQQKLALDPQKDLAAVVGLGASDFVLVAHPRSGLRSVADLVAAARRQPGKLSYASAGNGSLHHLAGEALKAQAGIDLLHVPYKGGPLGLNDVLAGQVDLMFIAPAPSLPHIQAGRLVALASAGTARSTLLPGVATVAETLPGFRASTWYALFAPAGTPEPVVQKINREVGQALQAAELRDGLLAQGIVPLGGPSSQLAELLRGDAQRYAQLARQVRLELN